MASLMNRRNWLKSGALLAGSVSLLPTGLQARATRPLALPAAPPLAEALSDEEALLAAPVQLRARLSANENPFGPSDKAKQAIAESLTSCYQYPMQARDLVKQIADYEGLTPEHILLDAGSSPLLLAAAMHFGKQGAIITGDPSYADLTRKAENFQAPIVAVPLTADYKLDLDAMEKKLDSRTALVYICNPNNPTGTVLDAAKLKAFTARVSPKTPIFIDEAYIDYLPDPRGASLMSAVKQGQNVLVARTFSKLYGFAGLRVGYVVAQPAMIKILCLFIYGSCASAHQSHSIHQSTCGSSAICSEGRIRANDSYSTYSPSIEAEQVENGCPSFWGFYFDPNPTTHIYIYIRN